MAAPAQPEQHGLVTEAEGGPWHVDTCSPVGQQVQANNALISDVGEPETRGASGSSPPPQTTASSQALLSFHP